MHLSPSFGKGRNVGEAIIGHLFGTGQKSGGVAEDGRIPVVAVTGTNGKTTVTRLIAHLFASCGLKVGMTNTDGVYVDGRQIDSGRLLWPQERAQCADCTRMWKPQFSKPREAASCARVWASTAARSLLSPTSARATTSA